MIHRFPWSALKQFLPKTPTVTVSAFVAFLVAGCGNSQVAECNKLIDPINKGHNHVTNFQASDAAAANKLARDLEATIGELQKVELKDEKLKGFQERFTQIYQDLSQAFRTTGQALKTASGAPPTPAGGETVRKAKAEVQAAGKVAESAAKKADALAIEINSYCSKI
ncbi:hypothetical protein [Kamptonema formosum]|uniref:hypothetical protein n=1 Tax=Kamptonema formosum TaxID=331992 RepID=UPI000361A2F5|nr:hypothetical protein [Oscillatoria sp. PCC 10802]